MLTPQLMDRFFHLLPELKALLIVAMTYPLEPLVGEVLEDKNTKLTEFWQIGEKLNLSTLDITTLLMRDLI